MNLEALFIIASVIGSVVSTLTGNIFYVTAPLTVALLMNFVNRGKVQLKTATEVHNSENLIASVSQLGAETQKLSEIIYTLAPIEKLEKLEVDLDSLFGMVQNELELINTELAAKVNKSENLSRQDIETKRLEKLEAQLKSKFGSLESLLILLTTDLTARVNSCENSIILLSQLGAETQQLSETIDAKASTQKLENLEARLNDISGMIQNQLELINTELTAKVNNTENSIALLSQLGAETQQLSETINTKALEEKLEKLEARLDDISTIIQNQLALFSTKENDKGELKALDDKILKLTSHLDLIVSHNLSNLDKNLLSNNRKFTFQQEQIERLISEIELLKNPNSNSELDNNKSAKPNSNSELDNNKSTKPNSNSELDNNKSTKPNSNSELDSNKSTKPNSNSELDSNKSTELNSTPHPSIYFLPKKTQMNYQPSTYPAPTEDDDYDDEIPF